MDFGLLKQAKDFKKGKSSLKGAKLFKLTITLERN